MKVVFFHRKPRPGNYSIENLFSTVRLALPKSVTTSVKELRFLSNGFLKRLYISLEAMVNQGDVNHVTGDINFIALFLRRRRTVLTIHDLGSLNHPSPLIRFFLNYFWIVLPVKRAGIITTVSEVTKRELLKWIKIEPSKIVVIHNPISELFIPSPKVFNHEEPTILQIGTKDNKNVLRLIEALEGIPCTLEIIGNLSDRLRETLMVSKIKFSNSENLSNQQMVEKYRQADVLAFVSTYEGFGMPIVEANAVGRVVVTSSVSSMSEIAGDAAHFVDPYSVRSIREGILRVVTDDLYRNTLIENGYRNRVRFDIQEIAMNYTRVYSRLYEGR